MGKRTTAAEALWRALRAEGVEVVFGHPGGAILPVYDALHRLGEVRHVLTRHEQAAAHAADGYARATGRVGVCLATSGPGATNLVTGLATAMMDSVPLVAVTGQVPLAVMGTQAFQETDIVRVTEPVTKQGFLVRDAAEVPERIREAFEIARSGRPGPVLVDLPKCVQQETRVYPEGPKTRAYPEGPKWRGMPRSDGNSAARPGRPARPAGHARTNGRPTPPHDRTELSDEERTELSGEERAELSDEERAELSDEERASRLPRPDGSTGAALQRAARLLRASRRPVVMAGRGVVLSGTCPTLRELADRSDLPVVTTLLGLDAFPATHPGALGLPGMHGTERANRAIQEADLILGLGLRFDDRVTGATDRFAPEATIVHFDIDPTVFGRTVEADVAVFGDLRATLPALLKRTGERRLDEWWSRLRGWEREIAPSPGEESSGALTGRMASRAVAERIAGSGAVVATDVGQHQMWIAQELRDAAPGTHLTSGGLGTMGYALPAAVGAAVGVPERPTWMVAGDGGFQMTLQELATVAQEGLPIRLAVVNNGYLGMVRQWQELFYGRRYAASEISGPDLVLLAHSYGIPARSVTRPDELEPALDWAETHPGPVLLDLRVLREENVYPMVPAGAGLDEMVSGRTEFARA